MKKAISIHALLAESDPGKVRVVEPGLLFLSTLSLRRATFQKSKKDRQSSISIHALLAESDSAFDVLAVSALLISIHALLAESDETLAPRRYQKNLFLSTLSLRRATELV